MSHKKIVQSAWLGWEYTKETGILQYYFVHIVLHVYNFTTLKQCPNASSTVRSNPGILAKWFLLTSPMFLFFTFYHIYEMFFFKEQENKKVARSKMWGKGRMGKWGYTIFRSKTVSHTRWCAQVHRRDETNQPSPFCHKSGCICLTAPFKCSRRAK